MLKEVRVLNSENHTHYYMTVRDDRLYQFYDLFLKDRWTLRPSIDFLSPRNPKLSYFISAPAVTGLSAVFTYIPSRFPVLDLLRWLQQDASTKYELGDITIPEVEAALVRFGQVMPLLRGDGSEIS